MVLRNVKMEVDHNEAAGSAAASVCPFAVLKNDHEDVGSTGGAHVKEEKMEAEQAEDAELHGGNVGGRMAVVEGGAAFVFKLHACPRGGAKPVVDMVVASGFLRIGRQT